MLKLQPTNEINNLRDSAVNGSVLVVGRLLNSGFQVRVLSC